MKFVQIKFHTFEGKPDVKYPMYGYCFNDSTLYWSMRFYKELWYPPLSLNFLA